MTNTFDLVMSTINNFTGDLMAHLSLLLRIEKITCENLGN